MRRSWRDWRWEIRRCLIIKVWDWEILCRAQSMEIINYGNYLPSEHPWQENCGDGGKPSSCVLVLSVCLKQHWGNHVTTGKQSRLKKLLDYLFLPTSSKSYCPQWRKANKGLHSDTISPLAVPAIFSITPRDFSHRQLHNPPSNIHMYRAQRIDPSRVSTLTSDPLSQQIS